MQFVYLLTGIAILIAWIGPAVLIILVVIGVVGLIMYALKDNNKTTQVPLANSSERKDSYQITNISQIEPNDKSNTNIVTPFANDCFVENNQTMIVDENIGEDTGLEGMLCGSEQCNTDTTSNKTSNWDSYHFTQKQKAAQYRALGMFAEEVLLIEETIKTLEQEGISCEYWKQLYKIAYNNLNESIMPTTEHIDNTPNNNHNKTMSIEEDTSHQRLCKSDKQEKMDVPMWADTYIWSIRDLHSGSASQQQFYRHFKEQFLKGNYLDIENNTNYAFLLMYDLSDTCRSKPSLLNEYYQHLIEICPKVESYTQRILKDIIVDTKKRKLQRELAKLAEGQQETCRWISKGEDIEIGGIHLCRGGFYVGNYFRLPKKVVEDNKYHYGCGYIYGPVINPELPIKKGETRNEYFCSYQDMTPQQRYAYLQWLSGNTPIEDTCVDLIQYYVYGMEIRLFIDTSATKERKQILTQLSELYKELKNLDRNTYSDYYQLAYSIRQIISAGIVKNYPSSHSDFLPEDELMSCDDYIDYIINQELKGKTELIPEDAYRVAKKTYLFKNLPLTLYENNIKDKFISSFQKKFKEQSIIQRSEYYIRNIHYIRMHNGGDLYSPENVNFEFQLPQQTIDVWKVKYLINEIVSKLQEDFWLYNNCMEWTNGSTPLALLQLPKYVELGNNNSIDILQEYLYSMLEKCEYYLIDVDSLLDKIGYIRKDEKSLYIQPIQSITNGLKKLKLRTVPLIDVDNKRLNFGDKCIIYKIKGVSQVERTDAYMRLELFVKLAVLLIQVDGCNDYDIMFVEKFIDSQSDTSGNARHLKAYFRWLQNKKQSFDKRTKDSIGKLLNNEQTKQFAHLLVKLSCNQGGVNNQRVDVLTKIFPLLGEEANNIHSQIHRILIDNEDFATVEVTTDAKEYVIAQPESQSKFKQKTVQIDTAKLSKLEAQTASAQNMLSEIFSEEENVASAITPNQNPLITILTKLLTKSEWSKAEVDSICKGFNVITGSMLEQINDYAYDKVDDVVIEDDDNIIFVNTDYKDQLI